MDGKDPLVKTHLINTLARFDRPDVNKALQEALRDNNKLVRGAALAGVARSKTTLDVALVSGLLLDPDLDVMNKAVDVIIQLNHPETAKYLIEALKAENEFSRRSAVEVLNAIGTTHSIKYLLEAVADEDWWVRSRASDALARIGGPRVVDAVLDLIKDKDENIRRAAIEILNTCRDKRAVDRLIEATRDKDWWVSERAADALAEIGDSKALPALLEMVAKNNRSLPVAIAAVGKLGNHKVLDKLLPFLQRPEKEVRVAAIGAVAQLAGDQQAEAVRPYLQQSAQGADETVARAVTKALQKLDGRLSPSGRFTGTATLGASVASSTTPPAAPAPTTQARATTTRPTPPPSTPSSTATARTLLGPSRHNTLRISSSPSVGRGRLGRATSLAIPSQTLPV
jgi:serine/threonine-protein kinase